MTELQISLIVIGAVIIIGVIVYNKWQEYRAHRKVERAFANAPEDVLMQTASSEDSDVRREPVFFQNTVTGVSLEDPARYASISITGLDHVQDDDTDDLAEAEEGGIAEEVEVIEAETEAEVPAETIREPYIDLDDDADEPVDASVAGTESREEEPDVPPVPPAPRALPVDDLIDYAIPLNLEEPVRAEKLLPLMQSLRYTGNKPVHFIGLVRDVQTAEESWQPVIQGGIYLQLKAGVQLANRAGAINEIEYSELITRLRQMADNIGAEPEVPDMTDVLKAARELYQFVAQHDARLGINVRTNGAPWSLKTLMAVLERQKLDLRPDGFFVMHDTDGSVLFSLTINTVAASETASRFTLLLDVPCVAQEKDGFGVMVQCAKNLCQRLNGILVDDDDRMLSDPMLNDIAGQVNVFYEEMKTASIPAGSVRAMRLFN
ncbi:cell division protein ZipA C-terminal FtsZ-binding domain-containing protein [Oxalobacter sp. OttesenSCG-928-P03]|nr:cell division protein ZipA C-terminal FtsZ-binding domain-containing protein [Oxalobacter sp. OttesenSCG-928-P03]